MDLAMAIRTEKIYDWIMENRATFGELAAINNKLVTELGWDYEGDELIDISNFRDWVLSHSPLHAYHLGQISNVDISNDTTGFVVEEKHLCGEKYKKLPEDAQLADYIDVWSIAKIIAESFNFDLIDLISGLYEYMEREGMFDEGKSISNM